MKETYRSDMPHSRTRLVLDTDAENNYVELYTTGTTEARIDHTQVEAIIKQLASWLAQRAGLVPPMT